MAISVVMPALELAQETGRLVAWRKKEGEAVRKGEPLMEVETDKAVVEVEAEASGILAGVRVREGETVAVGQHVAWILAPGEALPAEPPPALGTTRAADPAARRGGATPDEASPGSDSPGAGPVGPRLASPKARRFAAERGVDLATLVGSGPGGAVLAADLERVAGPPELPTVWRLMVERVTAAWKAAPQFLVTREVDAAALLEARERLGQQRGVDLTVTDFLVSAVARTLRRHGRLNASWAEGRIILHEQVNVGIATAVDDGVVVPVIQGADGLGLDAIAARRRELVARARAGRLQPADLVGGTFTISNLGMYGIDAFSAIVNAPQAAILAVGRIADRVVAREGRPTVRPMATLTLVCDHRVVDGARAAAFLSELAQGLETGEAWS